jgi:hypothetical protein
MNKIQHYPRTGNASFEWWGWEDPLNSGNHIYHNDNGPAGISYIPGTDFITTVRYYHNNVLHRVDGPAVISYGTDANITRELYIVNNLWHRVDGPARIYYRDDGSIEEECYYLLDYHIGKENFYTPGFVDLFILENS